VPIQTEHASTTIHGINVKINDSPEKMCGITRAGRPRSSPFELNAKTCWQISSNTSWRSFQTRSVS
ncbi:MAG: hypothetical protein LBQ66_09905, partial [Planctomycetaceae bacterium]|nr:hypothetical protein [Planctomycetaceae bacterium]